MMHDAATWTNYAEAFAFVGNSLLAPMNQTGTVGLEPEFWANFPDFGDARVAASLEALEGYAGAAQQLAAEGGNPVQQASVDYTKLFVGPPRPAAAPWETMYRPGSDGATVGFGQATFEMRALLREAGLEVSNENNQYADHIGIELLYLSVLCERAAAGGDEAAGEDGAAGRDEAAGGDGAAGRDDAAGGDGAAGRDDAAGENGAAGAGETAGENGADAAAFAEGRILAWAGGLKDEVAKAAPGCYIDCLLELAIALAASL